MLMVNNSCSSIVADITDMRCRKEHSGGQEGEGGQEWCVYVLHSMRIC